MQPGPGDHAPRLVLVYESGCVGAKPSRLPLSIGDGELAESSDTVVPVPEIFNYWLQAGRIDVRFLGAAQVDRHANLNSTVVGDYERPSVRLPGAGGAPEIASAAGEVYVMIRHSPRTRSTGRLPHLGRLRRRPRRPDGTCGSPPTWPAATRPTTSSWPSSAASRRPGRSLADPELRRPARRRRGEVDAGRAEARISGCRPSRRPRDRGEIPRPPAQPSAPGRSPRPPPSRCPAGHRSPPGPLRGGRRPAGDRYRRGIPDRAHLRIDPLTSDAVTCNLARWPIREGPLPLASG